MYYKIINPISGRPVSIFGITGKKILQQYITLLQGGSYSAQINDLKKSIALQDILGKIHLNPNNIQVSTKLFKIFLVLYETEKLERLGTKKNILNIIKTKIVDTLKNRGYTEDDSDLCDYIGIYPNIDILLTRYFSNFRKKPNMSILQSDLTTVINHIEGEPTTKIDTSTSYSSSTSSNSSEIQSSEQSHIDKSSTQDSDNPIEIMISNYTLGEEWQALSRNEKENMLQNLQTVLYDEYHKYYETKDLEYLIHDEFILNHLPTVEPLEELKDINTLEKLRIFIYGDL